MQTATQKATKYPLIFPPEVYKPRSSRWPPVRPSAKDRTGGWSKPEGSTHPRINLSTGLDQTSTQEVRLLGFLIYSSKRASIFLKTSGSAGSSLRKWAASLVQMFRITNGCNPTSTLIGLRFATENESFSAENIIIGNAYNQVFRIFPLLGYQIKEGGNHIKPLFLLIA